MFKPACLLSVYTLWPVSSCRRQTRRVNFRTHACRRKLVMGLIFLCSFFPTETQQRHTHTHTHNTNKPTGRAYCHPLWRNSNINICRRHRRISNRCEMFSQFISVQGNNYVLKKAHIRSTRLRSFLNIAFETVKFVSVTMALDFSSFQGRVVLSRRSVP